MAKRGYGLAGAIEPGKKIFYGSVFSQLQVGRATDLLCGVAAEAGMHVPSLRAALNAALFEACRCQGLFDSSLSSIDPVTIELGADSSQGALSIQFTIADGLEISPALAQALRSAFLPAGETVFKVDPQTRRAEIFCILPLNLGKEIPLSTPGGARFEVISGGSEPGDDPSAEYVELGDVEYEKLLPQDPGIQAGNDSPSNTTDTTKKILRAAMAPDQETIVASAGSSPEALAEVLSSGLPKEELARVVAGSLPEEELAQLVKGAMTPEELSQLVKGGLSEQELATIVKGSSTPEELQQLVKFSGDKAQLAETLLLGSPKEEAAELIKSSVGMEELGNAIATALPREKLAQIAATALPPEEFLQIARDNLPADEFVQTIKGAMTPQQAAGFAAHAIKNPEICKAVLSTLSPTEMAESLKVAAPQRISEAAQAAASSMSTQQLIETLSNGLPREEYARMVASSIPREEFSRILTDGLPPQEMARSLLEGLPKEKFAQLVASLVPKQELGQALAGLQVETLKLEKAGAGEATPAFGPTQEKLEPVQIAALLNPQLTESQALSVLSTVLPRAAAEGIFTGAIPAEHVTEALKPHLPSTELAAQVTERLVKARATLAPQGLDKPVAPVPGTQINQAPQPERPEQPRVSQSAPTSSGTASTSAPRDVATTAPASKEAAPASFEEERGKLEKAFQARLGTAQKSVEFYLLRSRNLETQLRAAEEAKRIADREAQAAKLKLENLLEASHETEGEVTEPAEKEAPAATQPQKTTALSRTENQRDSASPKPATKSATKATEASPGAKKAAAPSGSASEKGAGSDETRAKKEREAAQFFQKKAREFESDLRKAEAEIRRLNAEHAKELLKLSQQKASEKGPEKGPEKEPDRTTEKTAEKTQKRKPEKETVASAPSKEQEAPKQSPEMSALAAQAHPIVSERIRQLESKVRQAEKEKERLLEQVKRQSDRHLRPGAAKHDPVQAKDGAEPREMTSAEPRDEHSVKLEHASAPKPEIEPQDFTEEPAEITKPKMAAPTSDDDPADVEKKLEANHLEVERDLNTIAQKVERLKEAVPEGAARRMVDGLMTAIMQEKAKLMETSRELTKSVLKKELAFKNQEAMLTESVKQMRGLAEQRQAAIDRLKQQNTEIQQKMDRAAQSQSNNNETQFRMKYEQSQRQIELLNKEIEKANRRLQQAPQNQGNNLAQERMLVEMRKQIENATKAMTAKKQELEMVKVQLHERDRREELYKRQVMKLQSDLLAARGNKKAS